jgi:hypothetical protein
MPELEGFQMSSQLETDFADTKLFSNWNKYNQSLSRIVKPLNASEAQELIEV